MADQFSTVLFKDVKQNFDNFINFDGNTQLPDTFLFNELNTKIQESIILHCYIKDYIHVNNHRPYEVKITDPMILSVKSARKNKNNI